MRSLKNLGVGFLVSLVGSLPMGYINIVALKVFDTQGLPALISFLLGVVTIEFFLILLTLRGAQWLLNHEKIVKAAELLSIVFIVLIALSFYTEPANAATGDNISSHFLVAYPPLALGLFLNAINFVQVPFWTGWNVYLINAALINVKGKRKYAYVTGTSVGTFSGILVFVLFFQQLFQKASGFSSQLAYHFFPAIMLLLAAFQAFKFYKKHYQTQG
ncbi:hypothetical protein [Dyadobacter sp. CY351]|uniref:hypothetical protein n=1 Tax=Dyadobacter sp. CY351 TaxID=2909337 RepID=UPI001F430B78|nr:hypothetical protein [Dyadobacter sp. CY351]MCF2516668.1 hypothetical protein [Dyadobacter sp. CY351]